MKKIIVGVLLACALTVAAYTEGRVEGPHAPPPGPSAPVVETKTDVDVQPDAEAQLEAETPENAEAEMSYAFGMVIGADLQQADLAFDYDAFTQGFKEAVEGKDTQFTMDDAFRIVQTALRLTREKQLEAYKAKELQFLEENSQKAGIYTTDSGLQYEVITEGTGQKPDAQAMVRVNYEGTLVDGTIFDSSYARGEPVEFPLDAVIPGWTEGVQLMSEGSAYRFYVPSKLAYGEQGAGNVIPPYATLIFDVELLAIIPFDESDAEAQELEDLINQLNNNDIEED